MTGPAIERLTDHIRMAAGNAEHTSPARRDDRAG
jgi:hypothetical protein